DPAAPLKVAVSHSSLAVGTLVRPVKKPLPGKLSSASHEPWMVIDPEIPPTLVPDKILSAEGSSSVPSLISPLQSIILTPCLTSDRSGSMQSSAVNFA